MLSAHGYYDFRGLLRLPWRKKEGWKDKEKKEMQAYKMEGDKLQEEKGGRNERLDRRKVGLRELREKEDGEKIRYMKRRNGKEE